MKSEDKTEPRKNLFLRHSTQRCMVSINVVNNVFTSLILPTSSENSYHIVILVKQKYGPAAITGPG